MRMNGKHGVSIEQRVEDSARGGPHQLHLSHLFSSADEHGL
jgi:hypothetical protein